ncbi:MAG TPA: hypothetical protein VHM19_15025 [Polyangiales bacterium]|nr:hypothetical protein [Polyangiales bacterium]
MAGQRTWIAIMGCTLACGCATVSSEVPTGQVDQGDPNAVPSIAALPTLPRAQPDPRERVHAAFTQANELFEQRMPVPPADRSYASLSDWVERDIAPWIEHRRDGIDEVRFELNRELSEPIDTVVRGALVGLLQESTTIELERIPPPSELDQEPDVAAMFRDVIRAQAQPFTNAALHEYRDCANTGYRGDEEQKRWARFCHKRFDRLQATHGVTPPATPAANATAAKR